MDLVCSEVAFNRLRGFARDIGNPLREAAAKEIGIRPSAVGFRILSCEEGETATDFEIRCYVHVPKGLDMTWLAGEIGKTWATIRTGASFVDPMFSWSVMVRIIPVSATMIYKDGELVNN